MLSMNESQVIRVVVDTNILVASLWKPASMSADIVRDIKAQRITACYDRGIVNEYNNVLHRFKFRFPITVLDGLIDGITDYGLSVMALKSSITFEHESDRMFYDVAQYCNVVLITSNLRHYPKDEPYIMTPGAFVKQLSAMQ